MGKQEVIEIRKQMKQNGVQAYWVPSTDPHQSEYLPDAWNRRAWLTGFDGSAGDCLIMEENAYLWTDSRYFLQAEMQLADSGIQLMKMGEPNVPTIPRFLKKNLEGRLGIDPRLITSCEAGKLETLLGKDRVIYLENNLVDGIWVDRPELPKTPIVELTEVFSGQSVLKKLENVREAMSRQDVDFHLISQLDAVAWLFNIRGTDVMYNPVVVSYALVGKDQAWIFLDLQKMNPEVSQSLSRNVNIKSYDGFGAFLQSQTQGKRVLIDKETASQWMAQKLGEATVVRGTSPLTILKARKNSTELNGIKNAHERDGASMVRFFMWLEKEVPKGLVTEMSASEKLSDIRSKSEYFQGLSFGSISGYAGNGAIVHYSATPETNKTLKAEGIYLIDSGGQYLDGTTDITRTLCLGNPTNEQKDRFTRVLKGHLSLGMARFPIGTTGPQLDTLARKALWDVSLNYGHGTGHGVGHYLCVHEGPHAISYYRGAGVAMEPGMVVSNEPGYYKAGEYGIRIENLVFVKKAPSNASDPMDFLCFENLTMCPIQRELIDVALLTPDEKTELNRYHREVFEKLAPYLEENEIAWLRRATSEI